MIRDRVFVISCRLFLIPDMTCLISCGIGRIRTGSVLLLVDFLRFLLNLCDSGEDVCDFLLTLMISDRIVGDFCWMLVLRDRMMRISHGSG